MTTIIKDENDPKLYSTASEILRNGGLVAFPTETVYGLGGDALSADSSKKIYAAKGRPSDNPLIVHIADTSDVYKLAEYVPDAAKALMEAFWPGPLTIILKKRAIVPDETTGGLPTVAIRMPSHPVAAKLIEESGVYIAAPSANISGRPSPTEASHVIEDMDGRIDMIIDGGAVGIGIESTIVDLSGVPSADAENTADEASALPVILRPGFITKAMLEAVVGPVTIDKAIIEPDPNLRPKAPGMKYTHYAPKGELTIVAASLNDSEKSGPESDPVRIAKRINELILEKTTQGYKTAVLTTRDNALLYKSENVILLGDDRSGRTVAARLYSALRECDALGAEFIYSESYDDTDFGGAIMNRLLKAAGHRVITV
ncbi:MAG: threonylcarbamoyl-AMP synthase [Eubacterium sp.]|nr:threonylcarbamoyl-AMP synthase [Eubacterium sp.]